MRIKIIGILLLLSIKGFGQNFCEEGVKEYLYGDLNKAVDLLSYSIEKGKDLARCYMYRGAAKGFLHQFKEAYADLELSKKIDSSTSKLIYFFGKVCMLDSLHERADLYFTQSIAMKADEAPTFDGRATARIMLGRYVDAIADEDRAIQLDSSNALYYMNRGFAHIQLKQYTEAIKDSNQSLLLGDIYKTYANRGFIDIAQLPA